MVISSGFTFPWRERPAILPSMMMALGDCTMSLKVTVAASIRTFISLFTASLISAMRACVAKRSQRLTKGMAVCSGGTGAPSRHHTAAVRKRAGFWSVRWPCGPLRARAIFSHHAGCADTSSSVSLSAR